MPIEEKRRKVGSNQLLRGVWARSSVRYSVWSYETERISSWPLVGLVSLHFAEPERLEEAAGYDILRGLGGLVLLET